MQRTLLSLLVVALLSGSCAPGAGPQAPSGASQATQTAGTPMPGTSRASTTSPTATPSPVPTVDPATLDDLQRGYATLVFLESTVALLEETATKARDGEFEGFEAFAAIITVGALFQALDEALADPPPVAKLAPAWEAARPVLASCRGILSRWWDKEISSDEALQELQQPKAQVSQILKEADGVVSHEYGVPLSQLAQMRSEAVASFRAILEATPTAPAPLPPTNTVAPSSTAAPTSPSPASEQPPLEILSHRSYTEYDWFHIVGEVRNNTDAPATFIKVVATLYDDSRKVTGTCFTYTEIDTVPPGGKAPFELGTDQYAGTTQYALQVQGRAGELPRQDITILSHDSYTDYGWLNIRGEVQNTGTTDAEFVKIVASLYDAADQVIGTCFTYTELDTVPAGGTSPFECGTDQWEGFDHYVLQVQAR